MNRLLPLAGNKDKKEVQLVRRKIEDSIRMCLTPFPATEREWKIKILSVCTDESPLLENWKMSLDIQGYDFNVLGIGEKWGGWPWRTRQYIKALSEHPIEQLFVLTDATDLFFIAPPNELLMSFKTYRADVVVGAEHQCCTGWPRWNGSIKEQIVVHAKNRNPHTRYIVPNGGFIMGWRTPLLNALCANLQEEDDQHGYLVNWLEHPNVFKLDIYARLVANIVDDLPFNNNEDDERIETDFFEIINGRVTSTDTKSWPVALHFAGANSEAYNAFGKAIYGLNFSEMKQKHYGIKETLKKSWTHDMKQSLIPSFVSSAGIKLKFLPKNK